MDEGEPEYTVSYRYYEQTGYFQKKYININSYNEGKIEPFGKQMFPGISSQTSQQLLQIADLIHIRFADVLLMQSELKQDATGLNKVRARSHLAPVAYSLEAIKQERRWELAFESIRWWDILRWSGPSLEDDSAGDAAILSSDGELPCYQAGKRTLLGKQGNTGGRTAENRGEIRQNQ